MARGGIYKSEVVRARQKLLALGRHPSIDAIRLELGNTGSKATIHRYIKEIEEEEGGHSGTKVAISEALQDLVARLAERLHEEAAVPIAELKSRHAAELAEQRLAMEAMAGEKANLREALEKAQTGLTDEQARHQNTTERLQKEIAADAMATQQVMDLKDRLRAEEGHRRSLEEKHTQAREALEHFRTAAKEQREQDLRQHEQQIQYLQGEVRNLGNKLIQAQQSVATSNQECARLTSELAQSERVVHEVKAEVRALKEVKSELVRLQEQRSELNRQVAELEAQIVSINALNGELESSRKQDRVEIHQLQIDLAAARAAKETQDQLATRIQAWVTQTPGPATQRLPTDTP